MDRDNSARAKRAEVALITYDGDEHQWDRDDQDVAHQVIKDFLGDLRHLSDRVGVDFDAADRAAYDIYAQEKAKDGEGAWSIWSDLREIVDDGIVALVGDSNDAEHDALYALVEFLAPEALSTALAIAAQNELDELEDV